MCKSVGWSGQLWSSHTFLYSWQSDLLLEAVSQAVMKMHYHFASETL